MIEEPTKTYLKIEKKASQRLYEHVWIKGASAPAIKNYSFTKACI